MVTTYAGGVEGRSLTLFTAAFDQGRGAGTYVAMELFEGSVNGRSGTFAFLHSASTQGPRDRTDEVGRIVPDSGTGQPAGVRGKWRLVVDDSAERMLFDHPVQAGPRAVNAPRRSAPASAGSCWVPGGVVVRSAARKISHAVRRR